jgi:hypothetical protein
MEHIKVWEYFIHNNVFKYEHTSKKEQIMVAPLVKWMK